MTRAPEQFMDHNQLRFIFLIRGSFIVHCEIDINSMYSLHWKHKAPGSTVTVIPYCFVSVHQEYDYM